MFATQWMNLKISLLQDSVTPTIALWSFQASHLRMKSQVIASLVSSRCSIRLSGQFFWIPSILIHSTTDTPLSENPIWVLLVTPFGVITSFTFLFAFVLFRFFCFVLCHVFLSFFVFVVRLCLVSIFLWQFKIKKKKKPKIEEKRELKKEKRKEQESKRKEGNRRERKQNRT